MEPEPAAVSFGIGRLVLVAGVHAQLEPAVIVDVVAGTAAVQVPLLLCRLRKLFEC